MADRIAESAPRLVIRRRGRLDLDGEMIERAPALDDELVMRRDIGKPTSTASICEG